MSFYAILSAQVAASTEKHMGHANTTSAALLEIPVTTSLQKVLLLTIYASVFLV